MARFFCCWIIFTFFTTIALAQKFASIVIDVETGKVLQQTDSDGIRFPASLTKMMTLYILFEELSKGHFKLNSTFTVSKRAIAVEPSVLGLKPGQRISLKDIIFALITKSANDASVVAAEAVSGSIEKFAVRMNATAQKLGMSKSKFYNPHGLPNPRQVSTARDMATLSKALINHFSTYYKWFSTRCFYYKGCAHSNHNHLLGNVHGVDGIKTGYFRQAGSNIAVSCLRKDHLGKQRRLIVVILGGISRIARDQKAMELIELGFSQIRALTPKTSKYKKVQTEKIHIDPIGELIEEKERESLEKITNPSKEPKALNATIANPGNVGTAQQAATPLVWVKAYPSSKDSPQ